MHVNMAKRMFAWATTKAGFKHRVESYAVEDHGVENLLCTLVVRHVLHSISTPEQEEMKARGEYLLSHKWRLALAEPGITVAASIIQPASLYSVCDYKVLVGHFCKKPVCFDPEVLQVRIAKLEAMPLARVSPRTVRMPDGWYAVCGVEQGPFKSRDAAKTALLVMTGSD